MDSRELLSGTEPRQSSRKHRIIHTGTKTIVCVRIKLQRRSPWYACFLIGMCQNSVGDGQRHTMGVQKPLILPRHSYQATGLLTHCRSVLTNLLCSLVKYEDD